MKNKLAKLGKRFMAMALSVAMLASGGVSIVFADSLDSGEGYNTITTHRLVEKQKEGWSIPTDVPDKHADLGKGFLLVKVQGNDVVYDAKINAVNPNTISNVQSYLKGQNVKDVLAYYIFNTYDNTSQSNYECFKNGIKNIFRDSNFEGFYSSNIPCYKITTKKSSGAFDAAALGDVYTKVFKGDMTEKQAVDYLGLPNVNTFWTRNELSKDESVVIIPITFASYQPVDYLGSTLTQEFINKWTQPFEHIYAKDEVIPGFTEGTEGVVGFKQYYMPVNQMVYRTTAQDIQTEHEFRGTLTNIRTNIGKASVREVSGGCLTDDADTLLFNNSNIGNKKIILQGRELVAKKGYYQNNNGSYHIVNGEYVSIKAGETVEASKRYSCRSEDEYKDISKETTYGEIYSGTSQGHVFAEVRKITATGEHRTKGSYASYYTYGTTYYYIKPAYSYYTEGGVVKAKNLTTAGGSHYVWIENGLRGSYLDFMGRIPSKYQIKKGVAVFTPDMYGETVSYDTLVIQNTHSGDETFKVGVSDIAAWTTYNRLTSTGQGAFKTNTVYKPTDYTSKNHKGYITFNPSMRGNTYTQSLNDIHKSIKVNLANIGYVASYKSTGESFDDIELLVPSWAGDKKESGVTYAPITSRYTYNGGTYASVSAVLKAVTDYSVGNSTSKTYNTPDSKVYTREEIADVAMVAIDKRENIEDMDNYTKANPDKFGKANDGTIAETALSATIQDPTFKVNSYVIPVEVDINGDTGKVKNITIDTSHKTTIQLSNRKYSNGKYYKSVYTANDNDSFYVLFKGNTCSNADLHTALKDTLTKTAWSGDDGGHITDAYAKVSDWAASSNVYAGRVPSYIKTKNQSLVFGVQQDDPSKGYTAYVFRITVDGTPVGNPPTDQKLVKTNELTLQDYELSVVYPNLIGNTANYTYAITTNDKSKYGAYTIANTVTLGGDKNKLFGISGDASVELYKSESYRDKIVSPVNGTKANVNTNDKKFINYAYEISRQSFKDERIASGISYTKGSSSNGYQFATSYLGLSTGVVPKDGNKKLTADGDIRNSVALFSRLQSVMQMSSSDNHATHPFMYARRINENGKVGATTVGNVTFESVKFAWQDRANKYQSKAIDLAKVDASTRLDASVRAQDNKLTYRGVYLDNHVNTEKDEFKNGIVNNFYPEVRMYMQTHDSDLANISDTKQIAPGVGVLTMGEEKREAQNNSMYVTKIYMENDKDPVTGTIYSDTMSTGSQAENSAGTDPVIYAGSDITLNVNTNFSMSIYGYAVDGIHKEVNTADAEKKTRGKADSISDETMTYGVDASGNPITVRYSDIVKSNEDLDKAWGNKNNSAQLFADYKAYVKNMLDPDNIGVDVKLTVSGDSSYVTKEYNDFTCDLANQISTNKAKPTQQYVYPLEIEDGKVNTETVYYKALIEQIKKDYGCNSFEDAEKVFNESGMVESYIKGIESSNSDFNKSQTALEAGDDGKQTEVPNKHWYDEEVRTIVVRRYATENVKFGGAVLQDKIDYGAAPTSTGNSYKTVTGTWEVTLYFKNLNNYFGGDGQVYNPSNSSGTKQTGINSLNIFAPSMKLTGADFKIPSSSTQNMGD